jgi:ribonuclease VapC
MALFIRDAEVDALAEEVRRLTKAKTKTEAVRRALKPQLAQARRAAPPLKDRLARAKAPRGRNGAERPALRHEGLHRRNVGRRQMFVDASAIVAILGREPGREEIEKRLASVEGRFFVSPLVKFEASVALGRQKAAARGTILEPSPELLRQAQRAVDAFVEDLDAEEVAITAEVGRRALDVDAVYGKAVGHPADLDFGDCFAYACAKSLGVPLIYKGKDFARTDLA